MRLRHQIALFLIAVTMLTQIGFASDSIPKIKSQIYHLDYFSGDVPDFIAKKFPDGRRVSFDLVIENPDEYEVEISNGKQSYKLKRYESGVFWRGMEFKKKHIGIWDIKIAHNDGTTLIVKTHEIKELADPPSYPKSLDVRTSESEVTVSWKPGELANWDSGSLRVLDEKGKDVIVEKPVSLKESQLRFTAKNLKKNNPYKIRLKLLKHNKNGKRVMRANTFKKFTL